MIFQPVLDRVQPGTQLKHAAAALRRALPAEAFGYMWMDRKGLDAATTERAGGTYETLAAPKVESNPLPRNIADRGHLPADRGWWGYSFHDVPERRSGETALVTLPEAALVFDTDEAGDFQVCLIDQNKRILRTREIDYRRRHASGLSETDWTRMEDVVWIAERVYHNHSHWLTAHLPKLCLLKEMGLLDRLVLPSRRTPVIEETLRRFDLDPDRVCCVPTDRPLTAESMTLLVTDRFRPDLLRRGREALAIPADSEPERRIYISREGAERRRLVNEEEVWPIFRDHGFERVRLETLSFSEQLALMGETTMLAAPHGAGLTNQIFCPEGATVMEIADPGFPNPNFYAIACAMGHDYLLTTARSVGEETNPVERDLHVTPTDVEKALEIACRR